MSSQNNTSEVSSNKKESEEIINKDVPEKSIDKYETNTIVMSELQLQWQDHFQIRKQTWNTIVASGALIVGLFSIPKETYDDDVFMLLEILGLLGLVVLSSFGLFVAIHHRKCEKEKMAYIKKLESLLKIRDHKNNTINILNLYENTEGSRIKNGLSFFSTSSFIICYHITIILFCLIILVFLILSYFVCY